jgi:hypothetical protein
MEKPRRRGCEPAGVEIEGFELFLEVDLEPFAAGVLRLLRRDADELSTDASALVVRSHLRVNQERMVAAVPSDVHESDQYPVHQPRGHTTEAVWANPVPPTRPRVSAVSFGEIDELVIGRLTTPRESHVRQSLRFGHHTHGGYRGEPKLWPSAAIPRSTSIVS